MEHGISFGVAISGFIEHSKDHNFLLTEVVKTMRNDPFETDDSESCNEQERSEDGSGSGDGSSFIASSDDEDISGDSDYTEDTSESEIGKII